jgi:hypothetical protein
MDWEELNRLYGIGLDVNTFDPAGSVYPGERHLGGGLVNSGLPAMVQEEQINNQQQDSGLTQTGNEKIDTALSGLLAMATAFQPESAVQILPSPYKGGRIDRVRGGGSPGLMELMAYISQGGGRI